MAKHRGNVCSECSPSPRFDSLSQWMAKIVKDNQRKPKKAFDCNQMNGLEGPTVGGDLVVEMLLEGDLVVLRRPVELWRWPVLVAGLRPILKRYSLRKVS